MAARPNGSQQRSVGATGNICKPCRPRGYDVNTMQKSETTDEPPRSFFQTAVYNFFALYLGVTPPTPGKEGFYAALLIGAVLFLIGGGYLIIRFLLGQMLG
jgi:hypothetical protein